jgi:nicotinate-nucleotide--dimethylbenzimidazole phosphoribosyltransferase
MLEQIKLKIDTKTKPLGALGQLESLATQICIVQNTLNPKLHKPTMLVFAADHGIAQSGVSAYPTEVTAQMVLNFLSGGAAINVFCRQNGFTLKVVDAGVNADFQPHTLLINAKIAKGTQNFLHTPAMTAEELEKCFKYAQKIIQEVAATGCNIIGLGEMGIGNTSSASMLMSSICKLPLAECVGRGTGLSDIQFENKLKILQSAQAKHPTPKNAKEALLYFGGFEIAQLCGAMLEAYHQDMLILVDGFIATSAFLCAYEMNPAIKQNAIFCHKSQERGHRQMLAYLEATPLLDLGLRLGEGTGCALAYPIVQSAVNFMNEMASFESAGVTQQ